MSDIDFCREDECVGGTPQGASELKAMLDDTTPYWLCCGSMKYPHGQETCYEAAMGFPHHVRWGTAKEHSDWQKSLSSNAAANRLASDEPTGDTKP